MAKNYKLNEEIKEYIVRQKELQPDLSCRIFVSLIKEHFQVSLSKSLINSVLKENKLSAPVGRKGPKKASIVHPPLETKIARKEVEFLENGGCFFLKAADLKLALTAQLAEYSASLFPSMPLKQLQEAIEAMVYFPIFNNKKSLWLIMGKEALPANLERYSAQLVQISLNELNSRLINKVFVRKINEIKELHKEALLRLNAYVQVNFFPSIYKILDFSSMKERFYRLSAQIEKRQNLLRIQLFYPTPFSWKNDVVWQEDFSYAAQRVNRAEIFTPEGEQIWISPLVKLQDEKTVTSR